MAKKEKKEPLFRIGAILAEQGVKKEVFADLMGVNKGTVSEWINHKGYPEPSRIPRMAQILNINRQLLLIESKPSEGKSLAQIETEKNKATWILTEFTNLNRPVFWPYKKSAQLPFTFSKQREDKYGRMRNQSINNIEILFQELEKSGVVNIIERKP